MTQSKSLVSSATLIGAEGPGGEIRKEWTLKKGLFRELALQSLATTTGDDALPNEPDQGELMWQGAELMIAPSQYLLKLFPGGQYKGASGVPLSEVLSLMRSTKDASVRKLLQEELMHGSVLGRNYSEHERMVSGMSQLEQLRRNAKERTYQRMLPPQVACCVNALKRRTENPNEISTLREVRNSLMLGLSALMVFAVSFLVGYFFAEVAGVADFHTRLIFGVFTAVAGGLVEVLLIVLYLAELDRNRRINTTRGAKGSFAAKTRTPPLIRSPAEKFPHKDDRAVDDRAVDDRAVDDRAVDDRVINAESRNSTMPGAYETQTTHRK